MAPKRQNESKSATPFKKGKVNSSKSEDKSSSLIQALVTDKLLGQTYCEELGIDLSSGSNAVFQWLACSSMFGSRLSEVRRACHWHAHSASNASTDSMFVVVMTPGLTV